MHLLFFHPGLQLLLRLLWVGLIAICFILTLCWVLVPKFASVVKYQSNGIQGRAVPLWNREMQVMNWEQGNQDRRPRDDQRSEALQVKDEELALKTCFRMRFLWRLLTLFSYVWVGNALRTAFPVVLSQAQVQRYTTCFLFSFKNI